MSQATTPADPLDLPVSYDTFAGAGYAATRIYNCCRNEGYATLRDLVAHTETELRRIPNFGKRSLAELQKVLTEYGLNLKPDIDRHNATLPLPFPSMHERLTRIEQRLARLERMAGGSWESQ